MIDQAIKTAYLAPLGYEDLLFKELSNVIATYGRLALCEGLPINPCWAQNIWFDAQISPISSIGDAAKTLRALQRNWWPYEFQLYRRMKLIQEKLPNISPKPLDFLRPVPNSPLGSWTLIDEHTLLYASRCQSPMPNGEWNFNEDKQNPPSRAYLKLWELFARTGVYPQKNDSCLDLGASPGGWTWVLSKLSKKVLAFDKSPLDASIMALPNVEYIAQDAFKIKLSDYPEANWVLSDVVCYPDKLYDFICDLLSNFPNKNYVFTIKFQGDDHSAVERFKNLPGTLLHLSHNKHELTWFSLHR
jgi:23S rRNA (cytidine2498-2'-O)-methyltransferase